VSPLYKTRLCKFYSAGGCNAGEFCGFAHGEADLRPSPDFEKTSVCPFMLRHGTCTRPHCRYAHTNDDLRSSPVMLKTKLCSFHFAGGCVVGEACRFAHSVAELSEAASVQQAVMARVPATQDSGRSRAMTWDRRRLEFAGGAGQDRDVPAVPRSPTGGSRARSRGGRSRKRSRGPSAEFAPRSSDPFLQQQAWRGSHSARPASRRTDAGAIGGEAHRSESRRRQTLRAAGVRHVGEDADSPGAEIRRGRGSDAAPSHSWRSSLPSPNSPPQPSQSGRVRQQLTSRPPMHEAAEPEGIDVPSPEQPRGAVAGLASLDASPERVLKAVEAVDEKIELVRVGASDSKVVIVSPSFDADCVDQVVDCEDISWATGAATTLAGVGGAVILRSSTFSSSLKGLLQRRSVRAVIDIEDVGDAAKICGACVKSDACESSAAVGKSYSAPLPVGASDATRSANEALWRLSCQELGCGTPSSCGKPSACAVCPRAGGARGEVKTPCAACNCGLRVVSKNTFLSVAEEETEELQGARRRCRSS